jgi:hypothetical protein
MSILGDILGSRALSSQSSDLTPEELQALSLLDRIREIPGWESAVTYQQYFSLFMAMFYKQAAGESTAEEVSQLRALAPAVEAELKAAGVQEIPQ